MKRSVLILFLIFCAAAVPLTAEGQKEKPPPLQIVPRGDVKRYLGRWYEIARFQHSFEKTLVGATAEYSLLPDGRIAVLNSGFKKTLDGAYKKAEAVAWIPDPSRSAALKVKFFGLFTGDYLIFGLDDEGYTWALVGDDSRDFLWFLSRTPEIDEELYQRMVEMARSQGFAVENLFRVPQKAR